MVGHLLQGLRSSRGEKNKSWSRCPFIRKKTETNLVVLVFFDFSKKGVVTSRR